MPCCYANKEGVTWCKDHSIVYKDESGKEYCIFHAPIEKKTDLFSVRLSGDQFNELVFKEIDKAKKENRACDLSGTIFTRDISFDNYNANNPLPEITFKKATFCGNATYFKTVFSGEANFGIAKFSGEAYFGTAKFSGKAYFGGATFSDAAYFRSATFSGEADFGMAMFRSEADFGGATFSGKVDFGSTTFRKIDFRGETFLVNAEADFTFLKIEESISFTGVHMVRPLFKDTDLSKCSFVSCQWYEKGGRNILHDETVLLEKEADHYGKIKYGYIKRFLLADLKPFNTEQIGLVEDIYRHMKVKYKDMNDEYEASKWHASEKEMQRKRASIIKNPFDWSLLNLYRTLCGYAENPKRAFFFLVIALLVFPVLLAGAGIKTTQETPTRTIEISNLVKSPSTLSDMVLCTLQYAMFDKDPSFVPISRFGHFLVIFIKLFIPIQATLLIFALRNRFRR